jgi:hypothetical protein
LSIHIQPKLYCPWEIIIPYGTLSTELFIVDQGAAAFFLSENDYLPIMTQTVRRRRSSTGADLAESQIGTRKQRHRKASVTEKVFRMFVHAGSWFPPEGDFLLERSFGHVARAVHSYLSCMVITRSALTTVLGPTKNTRFPQTHRLVSLTKGFSAFKKSFVRYAAMQKLRLRSGNGLKGFDGLASMQEERGMSTAINEYVRDGNINGRLDWLTEMIATGRSKAEVQYTYCIVYVH